MLYRKYAAPIQCWEQMIMGGIVLIGIIVNAFAVIIGGVLGGALGGRIGRGFADKLNSVFGLCSVGMGISSIMLIKNMPVVVMTMVLGSCIGLYIHLGDKITGCAMIMQKSVTKLNGSISYGGADREEYNSLLVTAIVLFCSSSTGIYGSLDASMTGNISILLSKSILDLPTAMIFACSLGSIVCLVALPQFAIFTCLFLCAKMILPLTTPDMICDFKACGGFIMVATGLRIAKIKEFPIADMIPAMIIVMPLSSVWTSCVNPLLT